MRLRFIMTFSAILLAQAASAQVTTRGIGVYPGDPREYAGPTLRVDATTYRNLALHRPAFHSSSYDYNLTAQLVTDGVVETTPPRWVATAVGQLGLVTKDVRGLPREVADQPLAGFWRRQGLLSKQQRDAVLDGNWVTGVDLRGAQAWVQVELHGGAAPFALGGVTLRAHVRAADSGPENWTCTVLGSDDGEAWQTLGQTSGMTNRGGDFVAPVTFRQETTRRYYRLVLDDPRAIAWRVGEVEFSRAGHPFPVAGPHHFSSAWMSEGRGEEWVSVDLGAPCTFDKVVLHWLARPADGVVQASDDGRVWRTVMALPASAGARDEITLPAPNRGRYVRVLMTKPPATGSYAMSELQVFGRGGLVFEPQPQGPARADGRLDLTRGRWRLERDTRVTADGSVLATVGYADAEWLPATVPGTVLTSYLNAGAIPDPNFGDNQLMISDTFFYADFWYRTEFTPAPADGRRRWLHLDGINWNAEVYLNGSRIGRINGGFARGRFDITDRLKPGQPNALAIRIEKNASPGSVKEKTYDHPDLNGGGLGADNPTYHASIGWDWIPTIRGRNTGIWNDVYVTDSGPVTLEQPLVRTTLPLPSTEKADVQLGATIRNHDTRAVSGVLKGRFGDVSVEVPVSLAPGEARAITFGPDRYPQLRLDHPRVWWPNGYGEQPLYDVDLRFETAPGVASDATRFRAGVRQFTHNFDGNTLRMWINGRRFVPRGGNWGFGESMLRYRAREYDAAVRYHRDQHFTMIRNWVGQIGDEEFYDACDRYGIVVWQDFWLANPWDGPDPDHDDVFMDNATDMVNLARTHASVGLYCGRNEGYPPKPLDDAIRALLADKHPDVPYISSSADDVASGHGPYQAMPIAYYFANRATPKIHSELGMPNIMTLDSLKATMPEADLWPMGRMYGLHDFSMDGAQGGRSFLTRIQKSYGAVANAAEFANLAQFVNYEGYRGMFEAQSRHRAGLLIWMSHPTWPSLVWQTYDYFFEPTAAYFGAKKAAEPLHIQWNPTTEMVEVVNYSAGDVKDLTAVATILNMDGTVAWERREPLVSDEDSTSEVIALEYPLGVSRVHFIRLRLVRGASVVSENFYWRGLDEADFRPLRTMPPANVGATTMAVLADGRWRLTTELANLSAVPALMVKVKAVREKSGDRILPVLYDDNYVALMPGERRVITTDLDLADARGERPRIVVEGFNLGKVEYK
jgi:hypothetical protein